MLSELRHVPTTTMCIVYHLSTLALLEKQIKIERGSDFGSNTRNWIHHCDEIIMQREKIAEKQIEVDIHGEVSMTKHEVRGGEVSMTHCTITLLDVSF